MRHVERQPDRHFRRRGVSRGWWRGGRFRLMVVLLCGLAAAALAVPAASATGRLLAGAGPAAGRAPAVPGLAKLAGKPSSPAASASAAGAAAACPDLYFISVMGSGQGEDYEKNHHTTSIPTTGTAAERVSPETDAVYKALENQLPGKGKNITSTFYQLPYPAPSVNVLSAGLKNPFKSINPTTLLKDYARFVGVNLLSYLAGEQQGESLLYAKLAQIIHDCSPAGAQPMVVLAGYSQGAMVIHNVLNQIAASNQADFVGLIKGAVLIGDPERVPKSGITNFGSAPWGDYGICRDLDKFSINDPIPDGPESCDPPGITPDVSSSFSKIAYQVCDTDDIVCDTSGLLQLNVYGAPSYSNLVDMFTYHTREKLGTNVHDSDYKGGPAATAGRRVARSLVLDGVGSQPTVSPSPSASASAPAGTGTWTATEGPRYFGTESRVSCVSASQCVATGGNGYYAQLLTNTGGSWAAVDTPEPANLGNEGSTLDGVSCSSASQCVAVGYYEDTAGNNDGMLLTYSDGSWTAAQAPAPADASNSGSGLLSLTGVSCPSASQCVAVGGYRTTDSDLDRGLLLTYSDGSWTAAPAPVPANYADDAGLGAVSCSSASQCVAVGSYRDTAGNYDGLLLTDSDGSWTAAEAPLPANSDGGGGAGGADLRGVSCSSASHCVAVGVYTDASLGFHDMLLTDSGGSWAAAEAPLPAGAQAASEEGTRAESVSCSSASQCVAVGSYKDTSGGFDGLLLTDSGGSWTAAQAPLPADAATDATAPGGAYLWGVSCPPTSQCVAVGYYSLTSNEYGGLLLTGPG